MTIKVWILGGFLVTAGCSGLPFTQSDSVDESAPNPYSGPVMTQEAADAQAEALAEARALEEKRIRKALEYRELVPGMKMQDVLALWGHPGEVETAGSPRHGNQRWLYYTGLSGRWSLSTIRVVYFEAGKVVGWDTLRR